nr:immunoglobulin heavy chain junction region [Macaca mulatta]
CVRDVRGTGFDFR